MMDNATKPAFLEKLDPVDRKELLDVLQQLLQKSVQETLNSDKIASFASRFGAESVRSDAINVALGEVMAKTGKTPEDAILYALTLYGMALDAGRDGRLVLVDKDYRFIREVLGLGQKRAEVAAPASVAG